MPATTAGRYEPTSSRTTSWSDLVRRGAGRLRPRPGDWGSRATWFVGVLVALWTLFYLSGAGTEKQQIFVVDAVYLPIGPILIACGVRVARSRQLDRRTRRAWWVMSLAFALGTLGNVAWFWVEAVRDSASLATVADIGYIGWFPVMLAGLLMLPTRRRTSRERARLALDIITVMSGAFMLVWYLVLGPTITQGGVDAFSAAVASAYPIGDLVLIFGVVALLMRGPAPSSRRSLQILCAGLALFVFADVIYSYLVVNGGFSSGGWADALWLSANLLLVASASSQHYRATHRSFDSSEAISLRSISWLPYGAIAAGYGLLLVIARTEHLYPMGGMVVAAVILTAAVVFRQLNVLRENHELAITDPLTGIANRALLHATLAKALARSRRSGEVIGVLVLDLDGFKQINDTLGHEAGDAVLVAVGKALRSAARVSDTPGRLGGDEFAVVLDDVHDAAGAVGVAERVLHELRAPVLFNGHALAVNASVGVALSDIGGIVANDLLHLADVAMYTAKRRGSGGLELYLPGMDTETLEYELREALKREEFVLHYQPIVDLDTGAVTSIEALVRWQHPARGCLLPNDFIPLAEETGLIVPLGTWALRHACAQLGTWQEAFPAARGLALHVNLSARQILDPDFTGDLRAILAETEFDPHRLVLELAEAGVMPHDASTVNKLLTLRKLGVRVAIDDFGTGFASLSYLSRLPVEMLKIDKIYVASLTGGTDTTFSEAVVKLGQTLNLLTVAEGVETAEQLDRLRAIGCPLGQGFYFARPLDRSAMEALLASGPLRFAVDAAALPTSRQAELAGYESTEPEFAG